jgi:hypothetical protein
MSYLSHRRRAWRAVSGGASIALDSSNAGTSGSGNLSYSHTTTGSNVILWVHVLSNGTISSVTYGGNAMTLSGSQAGTNAYTLRSY